MDFSVVFSISSTVNLALLTVLAKKDEAQDEGITNKSQCAIDHLPRFGPRFTFSVPLQLLYCVYVIMMNQFQK